MLEIVIFNADAQGEADLTREVRVMGSNAPEC